MCDSPLTRVEVAVVLCHQCRSWRSSSLSPELRNYALLAPAHALTCSLIHSIIHSPAQSVITTFSHSLTLTHTNSLTFSISNFIQLFGSFQESSCDDKQARAISLWFDESWTSKKEVHHRDVNRLMIKQSTFCPTLCTSKLSLHHQSESERERREKDRESDLYWNPSKLGGTIGH